MPSRASTSASAIMTSAAASAATQAPAPVIWWAMEKLAMRGAPPWSDHSANAIRAPRPACPAVSTLRWRFMMCGGSADSGG